MTSHKASRPRRAGWRALALVVGLTAFGAACSSSSNSGSTGGAPTESTTAGGGSTVPASTAPATTTPSTAAPTAALQEALTAAYQAETGALATYRNVITALGSVGPFPNVVSSEEQHVSTTSGLFSRYGIAVPAAAAGQASPSTLSAACSLGVTVEQQIITMYSAQMPKVSAYPDVTNAFQTFQVAARDNHLPAFQHCA